MEIQEEDIRSMAPGELVRMISMVVFSRESELAALGENGRGNTGEEEKTRNRIYYKYNLTLELLEGELNRRIYFPR